MSSFSQACVWLLPFGLLILSIIAVPLRILDEQGLSRYRALSKELAKLDQQNERLRREVIGLQDTVARLRDDLPTIEAIARDELGMVRPGEVIVQF